MTARRVLFIHHSTGGLLLRLGRVRRLLRQRTHDIELWDHGYNLRHHKIWSWIFGSLGLTFHTGLSDGHGRMQGNDFHLTISNNSPKEYAEIFSRGPNDPTLKAILAFDIIAFKNCFPTSRIKSDARLEEHKRYYEQIIQALKRYKNQFVVFTPPPLRREATRAAWAARSRLLAEWLARQAGDNVLIFNFFDLLADNSGPNANMLKRAFCNPLPGDSHPNLRANRVAAKKFVNCIIRACQSHARGGGRAFEKRSTDLPQTNADVFQKA